nr:hypothetical protein [Mycoplasmopsis bovis]
MAIVGEIVDSIFPFETPSRGQSKKIKKNWYKAMVTAIFTKMHVFWKNSNLLIHQRLQIICIAILDVPIQKPLIVFKVFLNFFMSELFKVGFLIFSDFFEKTGRHIQIS